MAARDAIERSITDRGDVTIGNTPVVRQEPTADRTQLKHIAKTARQNASPTFVVQYDGARTNFDSGVLAWGDPSLDVTPQILKHVENPPAAGAK